MVFIAALCVTFFQVIHIFEEIGMNAYAMHKGENPRGLYLRVSSLLILLSFVLLLLLYFKFDFSYYLAFYCVLISVGNTVAHSVLWFIKKERLGLGFPSSIPLG
ncbi:MAG: hypothetical protein JW969_08175, partial [Spirochaetales bacterium]|nr:hypothetical protein [Spirochaetales bacterium]